ncbi:hypothetical protein MPTK1_3g21460 [Marchantia polymorpha subsp. ruderalis]|uniref:Uncharacterized protein n=2 Tax=Marchantia polymorpha TaxID=3197 RepID=A0AAF6B387_MARPO|nr:hypothetical protein MARPO_0089s0070 [Marchantia polymorpha]BBN06471.1 hypothetical protein Mp_3g21460 [Marchantia polymorpha subsp. ruderalis]|eukprot:PTQ33448.1 hypothetical protein MARPO_0089s0070 [Marchantia polymorpha]
MDSATGNDTESCICQLLGKNIVGYITIAMSALGVIVPGYYCISRLYQITVIESRIRECYARHILHSQAVGNFRVNFNGEERYTPRDVLVQNPSGRYMIAVKR